MEQVSAAGEDFVSLPMDRFLPGDDTQSPQMCAGVRLVGQSWDITEYLGFYTLYKTLSC